MKRLNSVIRRNSVTRAHPPVRLLAVAAVAVTAALVLSGCGRSSGDDVAASTAPIDDSPATGTVTLWAPDGDATALDDVLADFYADNPDLDLEITLIPSDQYLTKLQTAMSSGTLPDIAQSYTEAQTQFTTSGSFAPVPEGLVDPSTFFPGAWAAGEVDGTSYVVPWYTYTRVLIYRSDLAEAGGAKVPKTWDELVPFFKALQAGGAESGFGADVGWDTYTGQTTAVFARQAGSTLLNDDLTVWEIDTPEVISAFEYQMAPFLDGISALDTPQFLDSQPYLVQGKTGSMISGPWVIASLDATAEQDGWTAEHIATAPLPAGADGVFGPLGGGGWMVNADSENADSAWKVVREMAQPDIQIAQFQAFGSMPSVQAAWDDSSITDNPLLTAFFDQLKTVEAMPPVPAWAEVSTAIGQELEAVARGQETAAEAAAKLQSVADGIGTGN